MCEEMKAESDRAGHPACPSGLCALLLVQGCIEEVLLRVEIELNDINKKG